MSDDAKEPLSHLEDSRRRVEQAGKDFRPSFYTWQLSVDRTRKADGSDLPALPHGPFCRCKECQS